MQGFKTSLKEGVRDMVTVGKWRQGEMKGISPGVHVMVMLKQSGPKKDSRFNEDWVIVMFLSQ